LRDVVITSAVRTPPLMGGSRGEFKMSLKPYHKSILKLRFNKILNFNENSKNLSLG